MPATFAIILAPAPDRHGLHDVRLRITAARVVRYLNVPGVAVQPKHWNDERSLKKPTYLRTSHREHTALELAITDFLDRATALGRQQPPLTAEAIKAALSTGSDLAPPAPAEPDFLAFAFERWAQEEQSGALSVSTLMQRRTALRELAAWWGWQQGLRPLPASALTEDLLTALDAKMRAAGNAAGTRRKKLEMLGLYFTQAIKRGVLPRHANPLTYYELPAPQPRRTWLSEAELTALETAALPARQHLARVTFLLQYYLHGSRIGVVLRLQWKNRGLGVVRFRMDKGDREKVVEEAPQLTALLDSLLPADGSAPDPEALLLPWLHASYWRMNPFKARAEMNRATRAVNRQLALAAATAGITTKFSTHSSRRTLADTADNLTGDLGLVQGLLGHTTRATTERYTRGRDSRAVHAGAARIYAQRPMPPTQPTDPA